jgi:putative ABC transport system permease protein
MFRNYISSAVRNITKNPFYAILNIVGLTFGLITFIFIYMYVSDELSYDKYHEKHRRIYRLESDFTIGSKHDLFAIVPLPMGPALKLEYPEIQEFVRFDKIDNVLIKVGEKEFYEDDFYFADSTVFDVFTHECLLGELDGSLVEPNTTVLTRKIANKYFGNNNPLGQTFETGSGRQYKITAVIEDLPGNSHLKFDALVSATSLSKIYGEEEFNSMEPERFWNIGVYSYILINENSSINTIHEKFPGFYEKYMKSVGDQFNASFDLKTSSLADIHLTSKLSSDRPTGNKSYVYIFSIVALFVLVLASINYMNMATARSSQRSREVGMRKVMGAERGQLIWQFLSESILLSLIALAIAYFAIFLLMPDFNDLAGKNLDFTLLLQPLYLAQMITVTLLIGIISGSYPAFYLSSFNPLNVLKGAIGETGRSSHLLRRGLVTFQFFIAIVIIISTIVVSDQLHFLKNKDLGFEKENVVVLELQDSAFRSKVESFKEALLPNPSILNSANSTGIPGRNSWIQVMLVEQESEMKEFAVILTQCDYDYPETMGFKFVAGRNFDKNMGTDDTAAVIINEKAAKQFGWTDNPIGKKFYYGFDLDRSGGRIMKVIGVVNDYHFRSLHNNIEPIVMFISSDPRYFLSVRYKEGQRKNAIDHIEKTWNNFNAKRAFDYKLLTDIQEEMYQGEEKINLIFRIISALTIFIALLGLFGLSSFIAEQRTREIGIRKVNGATMSDILLLLYKEFFWLILIGFVVAVPVAYWRLSLWLESSFTYHVQIYWYSMLLAGLMALVIGLATISYHVIKVSQSNPVDAIKYE